VFISLSQLPGQIRFDYIGVMPRSWGYRDVTATYISRLEIPSRIYAKHQYMQESEAEAQW